MDKDRYVLIGDEKVYVTEEVYRAYYRPVWREAKQRSVRSEREYSLDALGELGFEAVSDEPLVADIVMDKLQLDKLAVVLAKLPQDEQDLINAMYFQGKSERNMAEVLGISSIAVHKRKYKILAKLHGLLQG